MCYEAVTVLKTTHGAQKRATTAFPDDRLLVSSDDETNPKAHSMIRKEPMFLWANRGISARPSRAMQCKQAQNMATNWCGIMSADRGHPNRISRFSFRLQILLARLFSRNCNSISLNGSAQTMVSNSTARRRRGGG